MFLIESSIIGAKNVHNVINFVKTDNFSHISCPWSSAAAPTVPYIISILYFLLMKHYSNGKYSGQKSLFFPKQKNPRILISSLFLRRFGGKIEENRKKIGKLARSAKILGILI